MQMPAHINGPNGRAGRWLSAVLPWAVSLAAVGALVVQWFWTADVRREVQQIEELLSRVWRARDVQAEGEALRQVARWKQSRGIAIGISAYRRSDGREVALTRFAGEGSQGVVFVLVFDIDRDHVPERRFHLCLKDPEGIHLLMME